MPLLKVHQGKLEEINKDIIRIHESKRINNDDNSTKIKAGSVCLVSVKDENGNKERYRKNYAIIRGYTNPKETDYSKIYIDESLREKLKVELNKDYYFEFKPTSRWWGWWRWAWNASDPAYQVSVRIAVTLGAASIILGIIPFLTPKTSIPTSIFDSQEGVVHSFANFISDRLQNPLILEGYSGYSLKFEKGDMEVARPDNAWRYMEVFKNNKSVLKIDSKEIEPWGYQFTGYDRYDFDGNSYFVIFDWCGGVTCGGQLVSLVVGKDDIKYGKNAVDWPINRSMGYSVKNGELYIYFYDEPNNTQSKEPAFFRFDKTSGNLIEQKVSELP